MGLFYNFITRKAPEKNKQEVRKLHVHFVQGLFKKYKQAGKHDKIKKNPLF